MFLNRAILSATPPLFQGCACSSFHLNGWNPPMQFRKSIKFSFPNSCLYRAFHRDGCNAKLGDLLKWPFHGSYSSGRGTEKEQSHLASQWSCTDWKVEPSLPLAWWAAWRVSDLPLRLQILSWGMSNWDSPKCLNTRIEINVPSLLGALTIHYSKHLPKVKWMFVYPHEIYIKTCWEKKALMREVAEFPVNSGQS